MKKTKIIIVISTFFIIIGFLIIKSVGKNESDTSLNNITNAETQIKEETEQNISEEKELPKNETIEEKPQITEAQKEENNEKQENISINNDKQTVEKTYFDDALFIGDSRTVGISEYGNLNNATFFANTGMSVYNVFEKSVSVPRVGKLKLEQLLTSKKFQKVYVMLGINELGYNTKKTIENYKKLIEYIKKTQSDAIIYIQGNLHVTAEKSNKDKIINNTNINNFNREISKIADNKKIFYIDVNEKFDDKSGNLNSEYTKDNVHIYAKYYKEWSNWLSQNAVKKGG